MNEQGRKKVIKFQSFLSGSSGNATFITNDNVNILLDCGANGKYIESCFARLKINPYLLDAIFITHEHTDHISGAGIISRRYDIPIYASSGTWGEMEGVLGKISEKNKKVISPKETLSFSDMEIRAFSIPHDAAQPLAYSFKTEQQKFTVATDMGHVNDELFSELSGSDFIIIEANHDIDMLKNGSYPFFLKKRILGDFGHLSNASCAELCAHLADSGTKAFWLGHLSSHNNLPEIAYNDVHTALKNAGKRDISLCVLPRYWLK